MIKTVGITQFSAPDYVAKALEGSFGVEGRKNIYFTCVKDVVFVNAVGPLTFDETLPENAFAWHLLVLSDNGTRTVRCDNSHLTFTLADGETAQGSYRLKA
ncbi:hypothetical protein [Fibrobacter sp.]|uniref:hypothetical protein n=1 Tax=Fibrobacter sp. TaxID=35828 RepID=UPI003890C986